MQISDCNNSAGNRVDLSTCLEIENYEDLDGQTYFSFMSLNQQELDNTETNNNE